MALDGDTAAGAWRSPDLGAARTVRLEQGVVRYHERGEGPVIVFAHGWLANANLWRKVVDRLAGRFRCIAPDLPLGSHLTALEADADLTPPGCGRLIGDFIEALDLSDVTLVGNDSGGAYSQIAVSQRPQRVARLALNACETPYDSFPPPAFQPLVIAAARKETLAALLAPLADAEVRASPAAYGLLAKHGIDLKTGESFALPIQTVPGVARDTAKVMASAHESCLQAAGEVLTASFDKPVLLAWAREDNFFPLESARRYAGALPRARLELIDDAYSFTPEDQPGALAELITEFMNA